MANIYTEENTPPEKKLTPELIGTLAALICESIRLFPDDQLAEDDPTYVEEGQPSPWEHWLEEQLKLKQLPTLIELDDVLVNSLIDYYSL